MKLWSIITSVFVAFAAIAPAAQGDFLTRKEIRSGRVTACSSYASFNCETARLVPSSTGTKLRLKSGSLVDCEGDCRDTLRRATVDFWHDQRERNR